MCKTYLLAVVCCVVAAVGLVGATLPLRDATAFIDQLFTYEINVSESNIDHAKITASGKDTLPSWLHYDPGTHTLKGVPTAKDRGSYVIEVTDGSEKDVFAITVTHNQRHEVAQPAESKERPTICKPEESVTSVHVILNIDLDKLDPLMKSNLIKSLTSYFLLKPSHIRLRRNTPDLTSSSPLVAGPGDTKPEISTSGSVMSWVAACGAVKSDQMNVLEQLEVSAKDGNLGKALKSGVIGWQVTNDKKKIIKHRRLKRAVVTATPSATSSATPSVTSTDGEPTATTTGVTPTMTTPQQPSNKPPTVNPKYGSTIEIEAFNGELILRPVQDLFVDEDGDELTVTMKDSHSWCRYDGAKKTVTVLAWKIDPKKNSFSLMAADNNGGVATATFTVTVSLTSATTQTYNLHGDSAASELDLISLMSELNSRLENNIYLKGVQSTGPKISTVMIAQNHADPSTCPTEQNSNFLMRLRALESLPIKKYTVQAVPHPPCENTKPEVDENVFKPWKSINVTVGELYSKKLPDDLFLDKEDVDLRFMKIYLLVDGTEEEGKNYITLDPNTRQLEAFTLSSPPRYQYTFKAVDSQGASAEKPFDVEVQLRYETNPTHVFRMVVDGDFSSFDYKEQIKLYKKIKNAFSGSAVTIQSIKEGSIVVEFSLSNDEMQSSQEACPKEELSKLVDMMFKSDGMKKQFLDSLSPYKLKQAEFTPQAACDDELKARSAKINDDKTETGGVEDKNTLIIVIPIVVGVVLLVIIIVVLVVVLRRRKRNAQSQSNKNKRIEKGTPVVIDEEVQGTNAQDGGELQPLVSASEPPGYPQTDKSNNGDSSYQPPTPPASEPDEHRTDYHSPEKV